MCGRGRLGDKNSTMGGQGAGSSVDSHNGICCLHFSNRLAQCICCTRTIIIVAFHALHALLAALCDMMTCSVSGRIVTRCQVDHTGRISCNAVSPPPLAGMIPALAGNGR